MRNTNQTVKLQQMLFVSNEFVRNKLQNLRPGITIPV